MVRRRRKTRKHAVRVGGTVSCWARTSVGRKREKNEDSHLFDSNLMLFVVADGMGGHAGGETASRMAVETLHTSVRQARHEGDAFPGELGAVEQPTVLELLDRAVRQASHRIYAASTRKPDLQGMGTTVTAAMFLGSRIYVAHVGDSRLYRLRNGGLEQLTDDHSLVAEQVRAGFITEEEAQFSRFRNIITRSVGFESQVKADTFSLPAQPGDVYLVCSDGLTGMVSDAEITRVLKGHRLVDASAQLVEMANRAGGEDNITLVLLRYKGEQGRAVARKHRRQVSAMGQPGVVRNSPEQKTGKNG